MSLDYRSNMKLVLLYMANPTTAHLPNGRSLLSVGWSVYPEWESRKVHRVLRKLVGCGVVPSIIGFHSPATMTSILNIRLQRVTQSVDGS